MVGFYYETTAPIRGRRVDKRSASTIFSSRWMRCAYPPYAGTFFICWGDETLNMIVRKNLFEYLTPVAVPDELEEGNHPRENCRGIYVSEKQISAAFKALKMIRGSQRSASMKIARW